MRTAYKLLSGRLASLMAAASAKLSLTGNRAGLDKLVPPSLPCLPLVALERNVGVGAEC